MATQRTSILVVDDDLDTRLLVKAALSEAGYSVTSIGNGLEAFQAALLDPPDLVVLDLKMPVMNGTDFVERLKAQATVIPPVLVISGTHDVDQVADQLGASAALRKPFDLDVLVQTVQGLLNTNSGTHAKQC